MKRARSLVLAGSTLLFAAAILLNACKHEPPQSPYSGSGYPPAIAKIFVSKCATAGCHNDKSYATAAGIRMDTWDHLFDGGTSGAVVVPYDAENSSLLSFINVDSSLGLVQYPTMPYHGAPLPREEYNAVRDWITAGAPDAQGNIPFDAGAATRQKVYLTSQGCDLVQVIDAQRNVVMRNIRVGKTTNVESPHCVRVSADGQYAYTCFLAGDYVQKIDTRTDKIVSEANIATPNVTSQWNILHVSQDGTKVIVADFLRGALVIINTADMQVIQRIAVAGLFYQPHGIAANAAFDTIYVTSQKGNMVYKISPGGFYEALSIDGATPSNVTGLRDPHEILLTPDDSKYFLTCETSNEVRVMDAHTDAVLAAIPVPRKPQELALSKMKPWMFVTCMEAPTTNPDYPSARGCVVVINYQTLQVVKTIWGPFFQPHGITVDDRAGRIYVASANVDPNGDAPHHTGVCGGRLGWYSVYDLNTLELLSNRRYETSPYPYSADSRFK